MTGPRLAVRAAILWDRKLLLVNAYPGGVSDLWCAPGGGVEKGAGLADNLIREVYEETGCRIDVGPLCLIHEFHNPKDGFQQVDLIFRAALLEPPPEGDWTDPAGVVTKRRFFAQAELDGIRLKPDRLRDAAFAPNAPVTPRDLEEIAS